MTLTNGNGSNRSRMTLAMTTAVFTIGSAIITYSITVTLAYSRLDRVAAVQETKIVQMENRIGFLEGAQRQAIEERYDLWAQTSTLQNEINILRDALDLPPRRPR